MDVEREFWILLAKLVCLSEQSESTLGQYCVLDWEYVTVV